MKHRWRVFVELALVAGFLAPLALAQKPPGPPPPPPTVQPGSGQPLGRPLNSDPFGSSNVAREDLVMFLRGRVTAADGAPVPNDALVERVCNAQVRQQVHISPAGDFSMQLGSRVDSQTDASGNGPSQRELASGKTELGIPRQALASCELRASVSGFSSSVINLVDLSGSLSNVEVGAIVVRRRGKIDNSTISALAYKAPKEAISAYQKGVEAQRKGKPANARKYFEQAVQIYPAYTNAWFQLGTVLEKAQQQEEARTAFTKATSVDSRFLPPFLSLASMAYAGQNWSDVLSYTNHILDVDPLTNMPGYVLDLDSMGYAQACFYNALANYRLNRFAEAEKSGLKTVHMDLETHFPQVHLLLAEIFAKKNDYNTAIVEILTYLEHVPHGKDMEQVQERLAQLEKVNASAVEKPAQK